MLFVAGWSSICVHTGSGVVIWGFLLSALCCWLWEDAVAGWTPTHPSPPHLHPLFLFFFCWSLSSRLITDCIHLSLSPGFYTASLSHLAFVSISCFSCLSILLFLCSVSCWSRSFRPLGCHYWHLSWEKVLFLRSHTNTCTHTETGMQTLLQHSNEWLCNCCGTYGVTHLI